MKDKIVYMAVASDFFHDGHRNIIEEGRRYGSVMIGLLTDEAIAAYKRPPVTEYAGREKLFSSIKGVDRVVPQTTLDYTENLKRYRPDYVVHGDNWKTGLQSNVRRQVIKTLEEWGGTLIEVPYTATEAVRLLEETYEKRFQTTENRRAALKRLLKLRPYIRVMEASNGLSGLIAEQTTYTDGEQLCIKGFDALWISSLCDSAWKGKPDIELVDITSRLHTVNEIMEVTTKPIIFDGDTGGKIEHFVYNVKTLERLGVSAIIIEDKKGLKQNSLLAGNTVHRMEAKAVFADKIAAGKRAQVTDDFMIIARLESLIAGAGVEDALERAKAYLRAGADGIMVHSKEPDGADAFLFMREFRQIYPEVPVVLVPTAYHRYTEEELSAQGAKVIIYANHLLRSAYPAMVRTARMILAQGSSRQASETNCMPINEIVSLISGEWE